MEAGTRRGAVSVDGPGLPGTGYYTKDTVTSYPKIPGGANAWKLMALYQGNYADYANPSMATAVVRVLPPHSQPWLSKYNGPNPAAVFQAPKRGGGYCTDLYAYKGNLDTIFIASQMRWLGEDDALTSECDTYPGVGLARWVQNLSLPLWGDPAQYGNEAVYGNAVDLGWAGARSVHNASRRHRSDLPPPAMPRRTASCRVSRASTTSPPSRSRVKGSATTSFSRW